ncbi:hypothetical protein [Streptacidiphilus sp. MAP12-16]|uniref:hypothetical protein n=1 Tax=Streptacidiphilus sp. MAP12-16 TaxID=3156300 RepID=UPI0035187384
MPAPSVEPRQPGRPKRRRLTPVLRLRAQATAALLLIAALLATALAAFATAGTDLHRLSAVSEPRATATADLYQALADLDAQHAKSLVVGYSATPPPDGQPATLVDDGVLAAITAQTDRRQAGRDLASLAASGASDQQDRNQQDVLALLDGLASYDALTGTEEYSATSQPNPIVGRPPDLALDYYDQAESMLQQTLLPRVQSLLASADRQVAADRGVAQGDARHGALLLVALGAVALGLMLWWQLDLTRRHRRLLNPPLLLASASVLAVALAGGFALLGAASEAGAAVSSGYAPYAVVAQAQVAAADAEAVQSRWLVDDAYRPSLQRQFTDLTQRLHALLGPQSTASVARTQADYLAADTTLRSLAESGQLDRAAVQLTGVTRGEVAFAYFDFSSRLGELAAQRSAVFDHRAAAAADDLSGWTAIPSALLGAALLLVVVGVRPRLAEFA